MTEKSAKWRRRLILIPIVHAQTDMGSSSEDVRRTYIGQKGLAAWQESRRAIEQFWTKLEDQIARLDLDFGGVRLYQDGLPVCGHELDIVRDLAQSSGPNYRILMTLIDRGAAIEGTEDAELLLKEYQILKAGLSGAPEQPRLHPSQDTPPAAALEKLLEQRDRYIAKRIDATLGASETGILFLGALHHIADLLPDDIEVLSLDQLITHGNDSERP